MNKTVCLLMLLLAMAACNKNGVIGMPPDEPDNLEPAVLGYSVLEYLPAPGQFINDKSSGFFDIADSGDACRYAESRLFKYNYVSLGAWGGYIVVQPEKRVNNTGGYDFAIGGNAFDSSNEPGIVWVMKDENGNGLPDDTWYELKGSYFGKEGYERDYWVTYFRPEPSSPTRWEDSNGETGYVEWTGSFHSQLFYYPSWVKADSYTLYGSKLPALTTQNPETGQWTNPPFAWGYVDNEGEDSRLVELKGMKVQKNFFRISDAVDSNGNAIKLDAIDFVKVQTGINGKSGVLGENSTEVCGFFF